MSAPRNIVAEKSMGAIGGESTFDRGLGLFDSVMAVVGVMTGSGIFVVSADMSWQIGSAGWLVVT